MIRHILAALLVAAPAAAQDLAPAVLRGGFVNRVYTVTLSDRTLSIVTYAEPGDGGRYEQFLVEPAN